MKKILMSRASFYFKATGGRLVKLNVELSGAVCFCNILINGMPVGQFQAPAGLFTSLEPFTVSVENYLINKGIEL